MFFYTFMPRLFNMSLTASVAILLVILLRLLLKKAPKTISYALWGVVLFRLLCPVSIASGFSLFNLFDVPAEDAGAITSVIEYIPQDIVHTEYPTVALPVPGISEAINEVLPQGQEQLTADPLEAPMSIMTCIWMLGLLIMVVYSIVSYVRLRRKLSIIVPLRDNIYIADDIKSPFVIGLFRPKICLPCNLGEKEQAYIILHEQHHIKRLDHVVKVLAYFVLAIHWFNPLVWAAFILAGTDMEMSCDEAVIRRIGSDVRADYSASLLTLATGRRIIAGTPLAFGEGDSKGRIKNLSKWKRPAFWIIACAAVVCVIFAVCLLTNPRTGIPDSIDIVSATYFDGTTEADLSWDATEALQTIISQYRSTPFVVGLDDPSQLSTCVTLNRSDGSFYTVHYQYYSGFSFLHGKEDDYRTIITQYDASGKAQKAWRMSFAFDEAFVNWRKQYHLRGENGQGIYSHSYGVVEVTYEASEYDFSMIAQQNTPVYAITETMELLSKGEYSSDEWTALGTLTEIELTKENFDDLFSSSGRWSAKNENAAYFRKNNTNAWTVIDQREILYYVLQQKNGEVLLAYGYHDDSAKEDPHSDDSSIRWLYRLAFDIHEDIGLVAVSGKNVIPVVVFSVGTPISEVKESVFWLDIAPGPDDTVPFTILCYGREQYGWYSVYDAETIKPLRFLTPSGLSQQTYLFQNAIDGHDYIVILRSEGGDLLCFGARIGGALKPEPAAAKWFDSLQIPDEMNWSGRLEINLTAFPDVTFRWYPEKIEAVTEKNIKPLYYGMPIWNAYFCDLTGDGLPELCSTISLGSGLVDTRVILYDYANGESYSLEDRGVFDYTLWQNESDGQLYVDKRKHKGGDLVATGRLVFQDKSIHMDVQ